MNTPFCDGCGTPILDNQNYCIKCGRDLRPLDSAMTSRKMDPHVELPQYIPPELVGLEKQMPHQQRIMPTGVKMVAVLFIILGIIDLASVVLLFAASGGSLIVGGAVVILRFGGVMDVLLPVVLMVSGVSSFLLAYGLLKGFSWAWVWTLISSILSFIASLASILSGIGAVGLVLYPIVIFYLTRTRVKAFFGK